MIRDGTKLENSFFIVCLGYLIVFVSVLENVDVQSSKRRLVKELEELDHGHIAQSKLGLH